MRHPVHLEELLDDLRAESVSRTAWRQAELVTFRVGVAPYEVGHGPFVRNLTEAVNDLDLVYAVDTWGEAAMDAEYIVVDDDGECEEVEHVGEVVPDVCVAVFARALGVEAVGLRDAPRLVVAADQVHAGWVAEFEADEEGDSFDAEHTAIYIVAWKSLARL